ncbi:shikimate dehydrogenase, partial [Luminiphilus sp.]|nr:shikimate dehydrogenase [Luminiphilus sp.]
MDKSPNPGRYAVVGNPIAHSRSPQIHAAFAKQSGRRIDYRAELVSQDEFEQWVAHFFAQGGLG